MHVEIWMHLNDCTQHNDCREMVARATSEKFPTVRMADDYILTVLAGSLDRKRFYTVKVN